MPSKIYTRKLYDIIFTGHLCVDEKYPFKSEKQKHRGVLFFTKLLPQPGQEKILPGKPTLNHFLTNLLLDESEEGIQHLQHTYLPGWTMILIMH